MAKRVLLIVMMAVSIAIMLSAFGLSVTANGPQNSGQSNPGGYVKYTLHNLLPQPDLTLFRTSTTPPPWALYT